MEGADPSRPRSHSLPEAVQLLAVCAVGILAGAINVMAGGGSLLTLPMLIFVGLSPAVANGTNRIGVLVQSSLAAWEFRRKGIGDVRTGLLLSLATLPGAILGALVAIRIPDSWFRMALAIVLVLSVLALLFPPKRRDGPPQQAGPLTYLAFFGVGLYGGFLQAGVGFLLIALLYQLLRIDLVRVNMYKVLIAALFTVPALAVFIASGNVHWLAGLGLAAGNGLGAILGTRISIRGGERVIRIVLGLALIGMAVKLVTGG